MKKIDDNKYGTGLIIISQYCNNFVGKYKFYIKAINSLSTDL